MSYFYHLVGSLSQILAKQVCNAVFCYDVMYVSSRYHNTSTWNEKSFCVFILFYYHHNKELQIFSGLSVDLANLNYSPALKKWGYTGFTMSFRRSVIPSFRYSVIPLFRPNFISTQYLENQFTESDQILYAHHH